MFPLIEREYREEKVRLCETAERQILVSPLFLCEFSASSRKKKRGCKAPNTCMAAILVRLELLVLLMFMELHIVLRFFRHEVGQDYGSCR